MGSSVKLIFTRRPERNVFDDTVEVFLNGAHKGTFKCNTQPAGPNPLPENRGTVCEGTWLYKPGIHGLSKPPSRRYKAFVQARPIYVTRADGKGGYHAKEIAEYSFNIHKGGRNSEGTYIVSSLGCLTIYPPQWNEFYNLVTECLHEADEPRIDVIVQAQGKAVVPPSYDLFKESNFVYYFESGPTGLRVSSKLNGVKEHLGYGIVPVRATIGRLLNIESKTLSFKWLPTGENEEQELYYNNYLIRDIDIDGTENVTWGYLADIAKALEAKIEVRGKQVKIIMPPKT